MVISPPSDISLRKPKARIPTSQGDYDFLAVRIPNQDAWYLVPQNELLNSANAKFYPHNLKSKGRHEKYRDAFVLL